MATTGARTTASASRCCTNGLLPKCNLFGYGQVESPYGSGEFLRELEEAFEEEPEPGAFGDPRQGRDLRFDQDVPGTRPLGG